MYCRCHMSGCRKASREARFILERWVHRCLHVSSGMVNRLQLRKMSHPVCSERGDEGGRTRRSQMGASLYRSCAQPESLGDGSYKDSRISGIKAGVGIKLRGLEELAGWAPPSATGFIRDRCLLVLGHMQKDKLSHRILKICETNSFQYCIGLLCPLPCQTGSSAHQRLRLEVSILLPASVSLGYSIRRVF
jgi:hypothetical protein